MADLRRVRPEEGEEEVKKEKVGEKSTSPPAKSIWDCGSPLYDSYELVSVTHIIERHWMIFPFQAANNSSKNLSSSLHDETARKSMSSPSKKNTVMNKIMTAEAKVKTGNNTIVTAGEAKNKKKNKATTTKRSGILARFFCCFSRN